MINEVKGNLLTLNEGILVHGCNCIGAMGSGIAGQIRAKWPKVYDAYNSEHTHIGLFLGQTIIVIGNGFTEEEQEALSKHHEIYTDDTLPSRVIVVNAMTQFFTAGSKDDVVVDYDAIAAAFAKIRMVALDTGLSVHFPLIGCGLANGKWEEVAHRIEAALGENVSKTLWHYEA